MSKVAIKGNASGTGTFTLEAPNSNTDRTLVLPDEAGTVLTSASTGTVLQVVQAVKTDTASGTNLASSGSFANALSASITPTSASNKILITYSLAVSYGTVGDGQIVFRLAKGATPIFIGDSAGSRISATIGYMSTPDRNGMMCISGSYLDSPATASSVTYNAQLAGRGSASSSGPWYLNRGSDDVDNSERQRAASSIILMEIAG